MELGWLPKCVPGQLALRAIVRLTQIGTDWHGTPANTDWRDIILLQACFSTALSAARLCRCHNCEATRKLHTLFWDWFRKTHKSPSHI